MINNIYYINCNKYIVNIVENKKANISLSLNIMVYSPFFRTKQTEPIRGPP